MRRLLLALVLCLTFALPVESQEAWKRTGTRFTCTVDNIAATLTEMTGCAVLAANLGQTPAYYISSIVAQSTTTTGGTFTISSGTGTNCGTGTTAVLASTTARFSAPANTATPALLRFDPPLRATTGHALCLLGVATNTTTAVVTGYIAP